MKKIISIISIFAMMMSLCTISLASDLSEDEEVRGDFVYAKGTNNIFAYIGNSGVCEIPENTTLKGLTPSWAEGSPITKLIINDNVNIDMVL